MGYRSDDSSGSTPSIDDYLIDGGEMADLVRHKDWTETPLGPIEGWPQSLRTTVSLCLASNFPINIIWGPDHCQIYNDGYRVVCGSAHPSALGQSYRVTWASAWPAIGAPFERALAGQTSFLENQRMFLTRNGYLEETFFTFSLSPIRDESGGIGGLFHPVTETTAIMLAERRTVALRDLTASLASASSVAELTSLAIETLSRFEFDIPFVMMYEVDTAVMGYRLVGSHGVSVGSSACPHVLDTPAMLAWSIDVAVANGPAMAVECSGLFDAGHCGPYEEAPHQAYVLPIRILGTTQPPVIVIAGASSRLPMDETYRSFFALLAAAFAAALATVRAREDERHRAEALAELDRAKTAFFSNVSHEFRTPLTLMLGPLEESLAHADDMPSAQRDRVALAYRNGHRLLKLVNTLLDFSRIEAGRVQARYEVTDLPRFTAELTSNFRSATDRAGLCLVIDAAVLPQSVYVDRDMWEKIVLNLLSNAFKFTFQGEIRVELKPTADGSAVALRISDTGTGIAADQLPRLFERFYRVDGARGRSFEGSGIGLSLVQELVKLHAGELSVESKVGRGTTFTVQMPFGKDHLPAEHVQTGSASDSSQQRGTAFVNEALSWLTGEEVDAGEPEPMATSQPRGGSSGRILLADDNADMRSYVERLLVAEGFVVEAVQDGHIALTSAYANQPDLVISDVMMPHLDGFGLLAAWRDDAALRNIPFILLSARAGEEARVEGLEAGADDYLTKPFSARELVARVRNNLALARDRREAALRLNESRLRELNAGLERQVIERSRARGRIWQVNPELLGVATREGYFETSNPAWEAMLGWSESELSQTPLYDFLHPDDAAATRARIEAALATDQPAFRFENRCRAKSGVYRWLSWVAVVDEDKIYCSARDVTADKQRTAELAKAQERLRQSQKIEAIGRLTGGVAHDFNNLLMVITGGLDIVERQKDPQRRQRLIDGMRQAAMRGAALTRQLLAFSRRQSLRPVPVDLMRRIDAMRELLNRSLRGNVHTRLAFPAGLWPVEVDPGELELMVLNLCVNARDAMPEGGAIEVGAENVPRYSSDSRAVSLQVDSVRLYVKDAGVGMSADILAHVFEPFFTTKDIGKGSGLGLAQVYGFVQQSGGHVEIDSEPGQGTTISMWLPRSHKTPAAFGIEAAIAQHNGSSGASFSGSVLLVEDDNEVATLVAEMLVDLGFDVTRVASAAAALDALAGECPVDLIFSDIMMPGGMDGLALAREIKEKRPDLPIVLTSGFAEAVRLESQVPGVRLLPKPFQSRSLATVMTEALPRSRVAAH